MSEENGKVASRMERVFGVGGPLAAMFEAYEPRAQQVQMAEAVLKSVGEGGNLVVEAGTGCGKSLGYLVPLAEFITKNPTYKAIDAESGEEKTFPTRAIVATGTKNLQAQLVDKDLPIIARLFPDLRYEVLYGAENFLSPSRLAAAMAKGQTFQFDTATGNEADQLRRISTWSMATDSGLRSALPFEPLGSVWSEVNCQRDLCKATCPKESDCFYKQARARCKQAQIIVVNQHLLMADIVAQGFFLPQRRVLVVDEAHGLDDVASSFLGIEISSARIKRAFKEAKRAADSVLDGVVGRNELAEALEVSEHDLDVLFVGSLEQALGRMDNLRVRGPMAYDKEAMVRLKRAAALMKDATQVKCDEDGDSEETAVAFAIVDRLKDLASDIEKWFEQKMPDHVYQVQRIGKRIVAKANPLDVGPILKKELFDGGRVVATSATLSIAGKMDYAKKRLGADESTDLMVPSPFDYMNQSLVYVANDLPEQKSGNDDATFDLFAGRIQALLEISGGRAMVLCTSYTQMKALVARVRPRMPGLKFVAQGEEHQRHAMVEMLKADPKTVLFGVAGLAVGVDIPGDALTLVIIARIPFANPKDPMVEAKCERLGRASFMEYSVPDAIVKFRQAFGRLIRTGTDWGVVAILDSRVVTKPYGLKFLYSLPRAPICYDLDKVREFFAGKTHKVMGDETDQF